jgi:hypothetical protein
MRTGVLAAGAAALALAALAPQRAAAQRQTPRRQTIEIRGQVPTPQVVTVRPRETPVVSRQVLVPDFFDRSFWPVILPGYQIVSRESLAGSDTIPAPPAPGTAPGGARPAPVITPSAQPRAGAPVAPPPATRDEELEAIRRELRAREQRLDSLSGRVRQDFGAPRRDTTTARPDTTTTRPPER